MSTCRRSAEGPAQPCADPGRCGLRRPSVRFPGYSGRRRGFRETRHLRADVCQTLPHERSYPSRTEGFNAIEFPVINHDPNGNNAPFAGNGALPFTKQLNGLPWAGSLSYGNINNEAPDFTQTNEAFWTQVDALLAYADSKGVLCFMFPAYMPATWGAPKAGWPK